MPSPGVLSARTLAASLHDLRSLALVRVRKALNIFNAVPGVYLSPRKIPTQVNTRTMSVTPLAVQNIFAVHEQLKTRVSAALHTQLGDAARLGAQRQECANLLSHVHNVSIPIH